MGSDKLIDGNIYRDASGRFWCCRKPLTNCQCALFQILDLDNDNDFGIDAETGAHIALVLTSDNIWMLQFAPPSPGRMQTFVAHGDPETFEFTGKSRRWGQQPADDLETDRAFREIMSGIQL